ncbi:N-acetylmuramidase domain-containing protein [uncultured Sphingomonas sp.]|uniref:N-acetylmuramidase domain-containing protein n=1 Tax=uncultured Sphingomonas sp. TaxID=158754 RepID=UPI0025E3D7C8|nr:N-acetylmuramidase domain-containing protein [uncultured Sphingomonas sp.]
MDDIFTGRGAPLTQAGFDTVHARLGGDAASLWSLLSVETRGFGFLPDRRPKILFERHIFAARTGGRFSAGYPDLSNPKAGGYSGGAAEYQRLKRAMLLDRRAALDSASWGLGQVMGFNAAKIGYPSVDAMVSAFADGEDAQLQGCAGFLTANAALHDAYKAQKWARVAFFYNGNQYAKNKYDVKLEAAHARFVAAGLPSVGIRAVQAYLAYLGFDPLGIDGEPGSNTLRALGRFRTSYTLAAPALPSAVNLGQPDNVDGHVACLKAAFEARFPD